MTAAVVVLAQVAFRASVTAYMAYLIGFSAALSNVGVTGWTGGVVMLALAAVLAPNVVRAWRVLRVARKAHAVAEGGVAS